MNNQHTLVGKIARLPNAIREKLNRRLRDGQSSTIILPWLNALPAVQKILAEQFAGAPVNRQNLTNWRFDGYQRWLVEQEPLAKLEQRSRYAQKISRAGRHIARGAATLNADKLFEILETLPREQLPIADLLKTSTALTGLIKAGQNDEWLKHDKTKDQQRNEQLYLIRDRDQRDDAAIALRLLHDDRAKLIESTPCDNFAKLELIGRHMFGDLWAPRLIPPSPIIPLPENCKPNPKFILISSVIFSLTIGPVIPPFQGERPGMRAGCFLTSAPTRSALSVFGPSGACFGSVLSILRQHTSTSINSNQSFSWEKILPCQRP